MVRALRIHNGEICYLNPDGPAISVAPLARTMCSASTADVRALARLYLDLASVAQWGLHAFGDGCMVGKARSWEFTRALRTRERHQLLVAMRKVRDWLRDHRVDRFPAPTTPEPSARPFGNPATVVAAVIGSGTGKGTWEAFIRPLAARLPKRQRRLERDAFSGGR